MLSERMGRAMPLTLVFLQFSTALDLCSCDCCVVSESHTDPSGAAISECAFIQPTDTRFLSASRKNAADCKATCGKDGNDDVLETAGREVDQERFCAYECQPGKQAPFCVAGGHETSDGNGKALDVVKPIVFHATARKKVNGYLHSSEWPSVKEGAHDVGFRTEELTNAATERATIAKESSELAEKVKVSATGSLPAATAANEAGVEESTRASDAMRSSFKIVNEVDEAAGQAAHSVMKTTMEALNKDAHATAKKDAFATADKLKKDMDAAIPDAEAKAAAPYNEALARAAAVSGDYVKAGDGLSGLAIGEQMQASQMLGNAQMFQTTGEMGKAQGLMRDAQSLVGLAKTQTAKANGMYATATKIMGSLGGYMDQAVVASYNAEVMLDPEAPPPPPPLVK